MGRDLVTGLLLLAFAGGAVSSGLLTWAACVLHRDAHYWRRDPGKLEPKYSRREKLDGVV